ncbi:MAG: Txe/YoeB family addiction module toxin [Flavobacteriales bacterium]|nr:Txe/YoeB family addiction module toxin [Flavobacteriales bacterium]
MTKRSVKFESKAMDEIREWIVNDRKIAIKILNLIDNIQETPFEGIGKPERLRHNLSGFWSRRITDEHRLLY